MASMDLADSGIYKMDELIRDLIVRRRAAVGSSPNPDGDLAPNAESVAVKLSDLDSRVCQRRFAYHLLSHVRERTSVHVQDSSGLTRRKQNKKPDNGDKIKNSHQRRQHPQQKMSSTSAAVIGSSTKPCFIDPEAAPAPCRPFHCKLKFDADVGSAGSSTPSKSAAHRTTLSSSSFVSRSNEKFCLGQFLPGGSKADHGVDSARRRSKAAPGRKQMTTTGPTALMTKSTDSPTELNFSDESAFPRVGKATTKGARRITPTLISSTNTAGRMSSSFDHAFGGSADTSTGSPRSPLPTMDSSQHTLDGERERLKLERARGISNHTMVQDGLAEARMSFQDSMSNRSMPQMVVLSPDHVTHRAELDVLCDLYAACIRENLVSSGAIELHFLVQLITIRGDVAADAKEVTNWFENPANCVYFAIGVLWRQRQLLFFLDTLSLRLLCENPRVKDFSQDLQAFVANAAIASGSSSSVSHTGHDASLAAIPIGSVAFQSETDARSKFISEEGFNVFRKKRDLFYEVLREWEANRLVADWSLAATAGSRIRSLVSSGFNDPTTFAHLARLFQSQLISMCVWDSAFEEESPATEDSEALEALKKADPEKYRRLSSRFVTPPYDGGACPAPSFSGNQEFFKSFIIIAGSHAFNEHLKDAFASKIDSLKEVRLNLSDVQFTRTSMNENGNVLVSSEARESFFSCLLTLRLAAKFLGFLVFLPYQTTEELSEEVQQAQASLRNAVSPALDLCSMLMDAVKQRRLVLVVPILVEYISMMDPVAASLRHYRRVLTLLYHLYRSKRLTLNDDANSSLNGNRFFLLTTLGWLFKVVGTSVDGAHDHELEFKEEVDVTPNCEALDMVPLVDRRVLYTCCPYMAEIRVVLSKIASGIGVKSCVFKKITPVSAVQAPDAFLLSSKIRHLQVQLEENFFHNHPASLQRTVEFVADRISSNVIKYIIRVILPSIRHDVRMKVQHIASFVVANPSSNSCAETESDAVSNEAGGSTSVITDAGKCTAMNGKKSISQMAEEKVRADTLYFVNKFCFERAKRALNLLLPDDTDAGVVDICARIAHRTTLKRISHWFAKQLVADVYYKELIGEIQKDLRTMDKDRQESATVAQHAEKSINLENFCALSPSRMLLAVKVENNWPCPIAHTLAVWLKNIEKLPTQYTYCSLQTANSFKTLYNISQNVELTSANVLDSVQTLQTLISVGNDLTSRTCVQLSVDLAMALMIRCPELLTTNEIIDVIVNLLATQEEKSNEFVRLLLCPRNVRHLTTVSNEQSWSSMRTFLVRCIHAKIISNSSLEASIALAERMSWPLMTKRQLETCRESLRAK